LSRSKRRAIHAGLLLLTLWPLAHLGLAVGFGLNPWKLAGWGMYAVPQIPPTLRIVAHTPDELGSYELQTLPADLLPAAEAFLLARLGLGRLVQPREFARALLEFYPAIDGVTIEVIQPVLDRKSALIEETSASYRYDRDAT